MKLIIVILFACLAGANCMNNGVARTPPMGWLAWERFRCITDCHSFPESCISEKLFMDMADRLDKDGWKDVGYMYVNIDDCWMAKERDATGRLYGDPERFPNGIKALADYVHGKGLKLGIYEDYGKLTCGGYPGSQGHEETDANTFAEWGIDMLKFDGCYSNDSSKAVGYPLMSEALNKTGRPMVYSCSWPAYEGGLPPKVNYTELGEICNLWRNYGDIQDSWDDIVNIIEWWATNQNVLVPAAGPGKWNDPDMLIVGDYSLSVDQSMAQFGMWAILAAPLFMSNDLRDIKPEFVQILQNKEVIAVSQDPMGIQGKRWLNKDKIQTWSRPLQNGQYAVAVLSTRTDGTPYNHSFSLSQLGIPSGAYDLLDLFPKKSMGKFLSKDQISVMVNPNGIVMMRATPVKFAVPLFDIEEWEEYEIFDTL
uniref:Alpha-galactosidase n=1 Tax=Phallusia mammillata TaxID=59560 RepID=A0A6F9DLX5_9ASCI|nr:alpha-N-acetylgalactosaminidase-like [Phallusia mammillata]